MADSGEIKSVESEYESDANEVSEFRWTARRMEASDDDEDDGEDAKDKYRRSRACFHRDESDGGEGAPECYGELEGGGVFREELEEVSQEEEEELQEKKDVSNEVFVPRSGSFYMHDDRFLSRGRRYRTRRGTMIGMKLWECTDEPKWKHDKFEDMIVQETFNKSDKSAPKSNCQQQRKIRNKGHIYADKNQFGTLDDNGNQNNKTSRIVRGRGPVKYKPTVKTANSSSEALPKTTNLGHDLVRRGSGVLRVAVRGSFQLGSRGSSSLSPVIQHGGLPYGAIDDHTPSMALLGYAWSQRGSRNRGKTSSKT